MNREPSAHSMTVETSDRENLAEKVFLLERWKAEAVVTIGKIEGERDEAVANEKAARAEIIRLGDVIDTLVADRDGLRVSLDETKRNLDGLLVAGFNTPPGECTNCAEMRVNLSVAEAAVSSWQERAREHDRARRTIHDEVIDLTSRVDGLRQANAAQEQKFAFLVAMVRGALDAL